MANDARRTEIQSEIHSLVWSGSYDPAEIALSVKYMLGDADQDDKVWLFTTIQTEYQAKRQEEETWPKVTDFDRLDKAFTILESLGLIALHRAGYTQSDGLEDVEDAYHEAGGKRSDYAGHCFYTEQDQESALAGDGLCIGFGHLSGNDKKGVKVGEMVRTALETEGFKVVWDGTINARLYIKDFCWQRRSP